MLAFFRNRHQNLCGSIITFWRGGWKGDQILFFVYINEEGIARIFLCFSKIYSMRLSKIQQSYWYTQFCHYKKASVFKPISNQQNFLAGCNLIFPWTFRTLKWMDNLKENKHYHSFWHLFSIFNLTYCKFVLWKITLSFALFKTFTVNRPRMLLKVFLMGRSRFPTKTL